MNRYLRVLHACLVLLLTGAGLLFLSLIMVSVICARTVLGANEMDSLVAVALIVLGLVLLIAGGFALVYPPRWRWLVLAGLPVFCALGWMGLDSAALPAPEFPGMSVASDDPAYRTLMWLGKDPALRRAPAVVSTLDPSTLIPSKSDKAADWTECVGLHAREVVQAWHDDSLGREWIAALDRTPPAGFWPHGLNDPLLDFKPVRDTVRIRLAYAYLLAMQGKRDEAVSLVLPLMRVMSTLQRAGGNLVTIMIGEVGAKLTYRFMNAVLELGPLSEPVSLAAGRTLLNAPSPRQIIPNMFLGEIIFAHEALASVHRYGDTKSQEASESPPTLFSRTLAGLGSLAFHPNRTEATVVAGHRHLCKLAEARDLEGLRAFQVSRLDWERFRNPVGNTMASQIFPDFSKVVSEAWGIDDMRLALLARLGSALPAKTG